MNAKIMDIPNTKKMVGVYLYKAYCATALLFHLLYLCFRKLINGKCSKGMQSFFSLLAFGSLIALVALPSAIDQGSVTLLQAFFCAALLLVGFGMFSAMAGAFRPYRYMKQKHQQSIKRNSANSHAVSEERRTA